MNKFLYIDGENVTKNDVVSIISKISANLGKDDKFIGKLYGCREQVRNLITPCLLHGIPFVETSVLSVTKKNVADMKIIVDCMCDISKYRNNPKDCEVYLLTGDTDFFPLIFKLIEMDISVDSPLVDSTKVNTMANSKKNLDSFLKSRGFYSIRNEHYLNNLFDEIKFYTNDEFSDETIEIHIECRTRKFFNWIDERFNMKDSAKVFYKTLKDLSFIDLIQKLGVTDKKIIDEIYLRYSQKIFGFIPKMKSVPSVYLQKLQIA